MPTYDYKCKECGITFEVFQKMTDEPVKKCIECNGEVKRLIGGGLTPIFKGSGFYETDYKSKKNKNSATAKTTTTNSSASEVKSDSVSSENKEVKSDSNKNGTDSSTKTETKK